MKKLILLIVFSLLGVIGFAQKFSRLSGSYLFANCEQATQFANSEFEKYQQDSTYVVKIFRHRVIDSSYQLELASRDTLFWETYNVRYYNSNFWSSPDSCYTALLKSLLLKRYGEEVNEYLKD